MSARIHLVSFRPSLFELSWLKGLLMNAEPQDRTEGFEQERLRPDLHAAEASVASIGKMFEAGLTSPGTGNHPSKAEDAMTSQADCDARHERRRSSVMPVESTMKRFGFRTTLLVVGVTQVLLAGSILLRGARGAMEKYGVPEGVLSAPHFVDAITWVYVHMLVLASMITLLGVAVREAAAQRWIARGLCAAHLLYTFMDARSSDSVLGNGLYQGAASNVPTVLSFVFALLFARLSFGDR